VRIRGFASQRGFTLMETMVAVLLLSIAIVGPLTIANKGIRTTTVAKDQDTAFYLAQDVVEYVRYVRDTNRLHGFPWLSGLDGVNNPGGFWNSDMNLGDCVNAGGTNYCNIDSIQNSIASCVSAVFCSGLPLTYDPTLSNYFGWNDGRKASIFTRGISIKLINSNEALVTVKVSWSDQTSGAASSITRSVTVRESLFNWQ
jgi:prepilin-type N-terminal cleavage/methylation domain-containing protein